MTLPGVPTKAYTSVDRARTDAEKQSELRQTLYGFARSLDTKNNSVLAADLGGAGWGLAMPHVHEPCYPMKPYLGDPGYTIAPAYCATFPVLSQQINIGVRWAVIESLVSNTAIGEFEVRWNKGQLPLGRGTGPNDSLLVDSWNSGTAGTKGVGGELIRTVAFQWPSTGPQTVAYREPGMVCLSVWAAIRTATGMAADAAKVAPAWCYQSGYNQA